MPRPKPSEPYASLVLRLPVSQRERLREAAAKLKITETDLMRRAVASWLSGSPSLDIARAGVAVVDLSRLPKVKIKPAASGVQFGPTHAKPGDRAKKR